MKSWKAMRFGTPEEALTIQELEIPAPGDGRVAIKVRAASVSLPDLLMIKGQHPLIKSTPFSPGIEVGITSQGELTDADHSISRFASSNRSNEAVTHVIGKLLTYCPGRTLWLPSANGCSMLRLTPTIAGVFHVQSDDTEHAGAEINPIPGFVQQNYFSEVSRES